MALVLVHKPGFMQNQVINCRNNGLYNAHNTIQLLLIFLLGLKMILLGFILSLLTQNSTFPSIFKAIKFKAQLSQRPK